MSSLTHFTETVWPFKRLWKFLNNVVQCFFFFLLFCDFDWLVASFDLSFFQFDFVSDNIVLFHFSLVLHCFIFPHYLLALLLLVCFSKLSTCCSFV